MVRWSTLNLGPACGQRDMGMVVKMDTVMILICNLGQSGSATCWDFLRLADDAHDSFIQECEVNFMDWIGELGVVGLLVISWIHKTRLRPSLIMDNGQLLDNFAASLYLLDYTDKASW